VPGKRAEKGYVLLRETLKKTGKAGIARLVIRTRQYLAMVKPHDDALVVLLMRFPQELVDVDEYALPKGTSASHRVTAREVDILRAIARGQSMKETARALGISPKTVDNHTQNVYAKIGVKTRGGATLFAIEHGLVG